MIELITEKVQKVQMLLGIPLMGRITIEGWRVEMSSVLIVEMLLVMMVEMLLAMTVEMSLVLMVGMSLVLMVGMSLVSVVGVVSGEKL